MCLLFNLIVLLSNVSRLFFYNISCISVPNP